MSKHTFNRDTYPDEMERLYKDAKEICIANNKGSTSLLQRKLQIGYFKAMELMDMLEERGVIGPSEGAMPRKVLISNGDSQ